MRILPIKPRTPEWYEARRHFIGGSDIPVLMGVSRYNRTEDDIKLSKTGMTSQEQEPSFAMKRGMELEPQALAAFEFETNIILEKDVIALDDETPYYGVSFDGITADRKIVVEAKCPMSIKSLETARNHRKDCLQEYRPDYRCQLQWQLMISKAKIGYLEFYHPDCDIVTFEEYPDHKLWEEMKHKADAFWATLNDEMQVIDF